MLGADGYVGYAPETVEGTGVAPQKFIPVTSFEFEDSDEDMLLDEVRRGRDRTTAMPAPFSVSGSMEMNFLPVDILPLLEAALGAAAQSSAYDGSDTAYQHVMDAGNSGATFTFEESKANDIVVMRRKGVRVNSLEIKAAFGEVSTLTFGLEGLDREKMESASSVTPASYSDVNPLHFSGVSVKIDDVKVCDFKDFTFGIANNNERIGTLCTTRAYKRQAQGLRDVTLSGTLDFEDDTEYDRFLAGTWFSVDLIFEGDEFAPGQKYMVTIHLPKVKWKKIGAPVTADYIEQAVEATIVKPRTADPIVTLTVINDEDAAAALLA